jgi:MOSC domain-containing protein YiiM
MSACRATSSGKGGPFARASGRPLGRDDFTYGQFGENFTVDGLADDEVCIGDRYRIGSALSEVSQPRVTCYRVGIRTNEPDADRRR